MLGQAKPFFTLILESEDRNEVERAAEDYKRKNPGAEVVVDSWRDHIHHTSLYAPKWRARARITKEQTLLEKFFHLIDR